jgi:3-methyl-2-oxobutanoate hydroxymethyltransferase
MSKLTPLKIKAFKQEGRKIVAMTVYDYPSARLLDAAGIDILLVGDSLGNVVQGKATTLSVTLDEMIYHAEMVARAAENSLVVVDLPFPFCQLGSMEAIRAAAKILKETSADAVKLEGGENRAQTIAALVDAGIPVLGHCGLRPQEIRLTGGYFVQREREQLFKDIKAVEQAGAFAVVLECLETSLAKEATESLTIPSIGIGAGVHCDGQVLVFHDILGYKPQQTRTPKHVKQYADLQNVISAAVQQYADEVRNAAFPAPEHSFGEKKQ